MNNETSLTNDALLAILRRNSNLEITHNQHLDYNQTVTQHIAEMKLWEDSPQWRDEKAKEQCIETNELWGIEWQSESSITSFSIYAPTLRDLLNYAKDKLQNSTQSSPKMIDRPLRNKVRAFNHLSALAH